MPKAKREDKRLEEAVLASLTDNPLSPDNLPVSDIADVVCDQQRANSRLSEAAAETPEKADTPEKTGSSLSRPITPAEGPTPTPTDPPTPLNDEKSSPPREDSVSTTSAPAEPAPVEEKQSKVSSAKNFVSNMEDLIPDYIINALKTTFIFLFT